LYKIFSLIIFIFLLGCGSENSKKIEKIEKIGTIVSIKEASGICYVAKTDTLFVVGDNGFVYEIDKNGLELNKKDFRWRKNNDFEGITYDDQRDLLYIAIEGVDNILVLNRTLDYLREVNIKRQDSDGRDILANGGEGLEGISIYNGQVYASNQSFVKLIASESDPSVLIKLDSVTSNKASIEEVIDIGYINISGMTFYNNLLYLVSDTDDLLIKYDIISDKVLDEQPIKEINKVLVDVSLEGVAFDNDRYIYFAIDDKNEGKIVKYKFF